MVRIRLVVVISMGILTSLAVGQEESKVPTGPPPRFATVTAIDKSLGVLELAHMQTKYASETVMVKQEGKVEPRTKTTWFLVNEPTKLAVDSAEIFDAAGKKVSQEDVLKRLTVGATVLVSADGKQVHSAYLGVIKPDTLIFVSPKGTALFGQGTDGLLVQPSVQKELKLSTEQLVEIRPVLARVRQKYTEQYDKIQEMEWEDRKEKEAAFVNIFSEEVHKGVATILKPEQHKRLGQIELQQRWLYAFFDPNVQKILKLTKEQQDTIKMIRTNAEGKVKFARIFPRSHLLGGMQWAAIDQAVAVLSADQRNAWEDLTGEVFELK